MEGSDNTIFKAILPEIGYKIRRKNYHVHFKYSTGQIAPGIYQMNNAPRTSIMSRMDIGNPKLKPTYTHVLEADYIYQKESGISYLSISPQYKLENNHISQFTTILERDTLISGDSIPRETIISQPVNVNGTYSGGISAYYIHPAGRASTLSYQLNISKKSGSIYREEQNMVVNEYAGSVSINSNIKAGKRLKVLMENSFYYYQSENATKRELIANSTTDKFTYRIIYNPGSVGNVQFYHSFNFIGYQGIWNKYQMVNLSITFTPSKVPYLHTELKCINLLAANTTFNQAGNDIGFEISQRSAPGRYFLLTISYTLAPKTSMQP